MHVHHGEKRVCRVDYRSAGEGGDPGSAEIMCHIQRVVEESEQGVS